LTNYQNITKVIELSQAANTSVPSTITLAGPDDGTAYDLGRVGKITLAWIGQNIEGGYRLLLNNSNDFSSPAFSIETDDENADISTTDIDKTLADLGVANESETTLHWTVKPADESIVLEEATAVKTVKVKRVRAGVAGTMFDAVFKDDGSAQDVSAQGFPIQLVMNANYPLSVSFNETYGRNAVAFNPEKIGGATSYYRTEYRENAYFTSSLAAGHTFECLVKFDDAYDGTFNGETKFFSSHGGGGTGFLITNYTPPERANEITFLPNIPATEGGSSNWIWHAHSGVKPDGVSWYHLVGVWNKDAGKVTIYLNGEKKGEGNAAGFYRPTEDKSRWLGIGGDSASGGIEAAFRGSIAIARIYASPLTEEQAVALWNAVRPE
jgi:hypothetical protein